nr:MAG: baculoviral IAP repeat-containing protein [Marsupenaeus japonicus endogenous nimavirus]
MLTDKDKELIHNNFFHEQNRVNTFRRFTLTDYDIYKLPIHHVLLAKAGFFYINNHIKCFTCDLTIDLKTIRTSDDIIQIHKERSPECLFAQSLYSFENIEKYCKPRIHKAFTKGTNGAHYRLYWEKFRLETFTNWPIDWISPIDLAADGFFYLKVKDYVKCIFCDIILIMFEKGDIVRNEHKRLSPRCSFILGEFTLNVPNVKMNIFDKLSDRDTYKPSPEREKLFVKGVLKYTTSKTSNMTKEERLESFKDWPECVGQEPQALAEAGFFYCGISDHVQCFHCRGIIRNWEKNDIPLHEHAKWFPNCDYLLLLKGKKIIDNIQDQLSSEVALHNSYDHLDIMMELDIVKCVLALGYSTINAKSTLKKHIDETGWPYLRIDPYICDMKQNDPEPPSIIRHLISETKDAYILSLRSRIESLSSRSESPSTSVNNTSKRLENMKTITSQETLLNVENMEIENMETFTSQETLSNTKNLESSLEQMREDRICKVCMDNDERVVYLPCTHMAACTLCTLPLRTCPICRMEIEYIIKPTVI